MNVKKIAIGFAAALLLVACGGGGGSAGSTSFGTSTNAVAPVKGTPTITLTIVDSSDVPPASNSITSGAPFFVKAVLKDANQIAIANKLVSFSTASSVASLAQSSALTDANGIARVQIAPVSLTNVNAGNLVASATIDSVAVTSNIDFQTSAANVTLVDFRGTPSLLSALQSSAVTVGARVNGSVAGSSVVVVNFSASCGTFSPASAPTSSSGTASSTYQSLVTCSGPVTLTAQAPGASIVTTTINVTAALPANVVFNSATVPLLVSSGASGGLKQSTLKFQVVDSTGNGMSGQAVNISLGNSTISAGVTFSVGGVATTEPQLVTTDNAGFASVTVTSGSLPTPVIVTAALQVNPSIQAASSGVAVTSGRATQNAASLSATKLSIEAFGTDGVQTVLTMRVADRQGNPVPAGAVVNFVASHGLVQGSCSVDLASQCNVTYTSQGAIRGFDGKGRVAILAFMDGEESFIDLNGDNIWQPGEPFYDVGTLYRDDNESGVYDVASEQTYPGGSVGVSGCAGVGFAYPSVLNTCDGTWSASIRVRQQIVIALATSTPKVTLTSARTKSGFEVGITDLNGNGMPTGTTVSAVVSTSDPICKVVGNVSPNIVRNSANGGKHVVFLDEAADCLTVAVSVTVTTPAGVATTFKF